MNIRINLRIVIIVFCVALLTALKATGVLAQNATRPSYGSHDVYANDQYPKTRPLNALNEQFLMRQRNTVEQLVRENFGRSLSDADTNKLLLQRVIDNALIDRTETLELQALGVVLGDIFVARHEALQWRVYEDELGKTHAVCVSDSHHCLFPITMLSRRMEVGLKPSVNRIFNKGIDEIFAYLPVLPYGENFSNKKK